MLAFKEVWLDVYIKDIATQALDGIIEW